MPSGRARRSLAAAAALALAFAACGREAPLEDRVQQRLETKDFDGALALLELKGMVRQVGNMNYVRAREARGRYDA